MFSINFAENIVMRKIRLYGLTCMALLCFSSVALLCNVSFPEEQLPKRGGTLVLGTTSGLVEFNPWLTLSPQSNFVSGQVMNSLVYMNSEFEIVPDLAESWEISPDGLSYTFHLVHNATFHDGVPFTSADVKYTFEEVATTTKSAYIYEDILTRVDTPDNYTAILRLSKPCPFFMDMIGTIYKSGGILPKHLYEGTNVVENPYNKEPIGTGPFKFVEWKKGEKCVMDRNPNYFKTDEWGNQLPYLDGVVIAVISDPDAMFTAFEAGEVDIWPIVETPRYDDLEAISGVALTIKGGWGYQVVAQAFLNHQEFPTNNLEVRKALAHAADRELVIEAAYAGRADIANTPLYTISPYHNPNVPGYEYDPAKAEQILDDAGFPRGTDGWRFDGLEVELASDITRGLEYKAAEILTDNFRSIGINVKQLALDYPMFCDTMAEHSVNIWGAFYSSGPDPSLGSPTRTMHSELTQGAWANVGLYNNSRVDELLDAAMYEQDQVKRTAMWHEVQQIAYEDVFAVFLCEKHYIGAYHTDYVGFPADPLGGARGPLDLVYWTKGEEIAGAPIQWPIVIAVIAVVVVIAVVAILWYRKTHSP